MTRTEIEALPPFPEVTEAPHQDVPHHLDPTARSAWTGAVTLTETEVARATTAPELDVLLRMILVAPHHPREPALTMARHSEGRQEMGHQEGYHGMDQ